MKNTIKNTPLLGHIAMTANEWWNQKRRWLRKYLFYLRHKKYLKPNMALKDRFKGKRAFILACGPSINNQDLSKLAGEFCISVSNFFVHKDFKIIKPEYHVFAESHSPITDNQMTAWLQDAEKHFSPGQKVIITTTDKYLIDRHNPLPNSKIYYYDIDGYKKISPYGKIDFTKRVPHIQTVAHQAIYLAMYSGASEIYLLGVDHDWIKHLGDSQHFYKGDKSVLHKTGISEWATDWQSHFESYVNLWKIYKRIAVYAYNQGVRILNATPGSLLDIFPKADLTEILKKNA